MCIHSPRALPGEIKVQPHQLPVLCAHLSQCHLQHGRQTEVEVEQRNGVLDLDARPLVLVREGSDHDSIDRLLRVLAAVQHNLRVRLCRDRKTGHLSSSLLLTRARVSKYKVQSANYTP